MGIGVQGVRQMVGHEAVVDVLALLLAGHQPGVLQHGQMLGDGRLGDLEPRRDATRGAVYRCQGPRWGCTESDLPRRPESGEGDVMDANTLTIMLFLFASALLLGVEAVKSSGKLRVGFGAGALAFVLLGLFWEPAAAMFPEAASAIGQIAAFPPSWFVLIMVIFLVVRERWTGGRTWSSLLNAGRSEPEPLPPTTAENAVGQIDAIRDMLAAIQADDKQTHLTARAAFETANGLTELTERASQKLDSVHQLADLASQNGDAAQSTADTAINRTIEQSGAIQALEETSGRLEIIVDGMTQKVTEHGSDIAALTKTVDRLLKAQFAMQTRDAMDHNEAEIAADDALLFFQTAQDVKAADWAGWAAREARWRQAVSTWIRLAKPYGDGDLSARIINVTSDKLRGEWNLKDTDFPDGDRMIQYRTFCVMRKNFAETKEAIGEAIYRATYG